MPGTFVQLQSTRNSHHLPMIARLNSAKLVALGLCQCAHGIPHLLGYHVRFVCCVVENVFAGRCTRRMHWKKRWDWGEREPLSVMNPCEISRWQHFGFIEKGMSVKTLPVY